MKRLALLLTAITLLVGCLPKKPFGKYYYIESIPPEAEVWVLGQKIGETPLEVELTLGSELVIKKEGYQDELSNTSKAVTQYINVNLKKLHEIKLNYIPNGSEVWENGSLIGKTPLVVHKVSGHYKLLIRFNHHFDLTDEFDVEGDEYRIKLLKPSMRYFPETVCKFSSIPNGVRVEHYGVEGGVITESMSVLGVTPFDKTNAELSKSTSEQLMIFRKEGFAPAVLTAKGSIAAEIKMVKAESYEMPTGKWFSSLEYKTGQLTSPDKAHTFFAEKRDSKFCVISKIGDLEVDILDMKTDYSDISGAAWLDDRFFVVRGKNAQGQTFYMAYDAHVRKKFRIENVNIWHEAEIPGDIEWKMTVPIKPSQIESFADACVNVSKTFSVCAFRIYGGLPVDFVVTSDIKFESQKLIACIERKQE